MILVVSEMLFREETDAEIRIRWFSSLPASQWLIERLVLASSIVSLQVIEFLLILLRSKKKEEAKIAALFC